MCKKAGGWTNKLFNLAKRAEYGESGGQQFGIPILIEGPYGNYHFLLSLILVIVPLPSS